MISIGRLSNATAAADYYLQRQADCQADYYTGVGGRRGGWLGRGATALGLTGELTSRDDVRFRGLLAGRHPDGSVLAAPVLRVDPRGRLDARPLVTAVRAANPARLSEPWPAFDSLARHVDRSPLASVTVRADASLTIATAAGLDARTVYADLGLSLDDALVHLDKRIDVRRPGYDVVLSAPKSVSVAYGLGSNDTSREVREAQASAVRAGRTVGAHPRVGCTGLHRAGLPDGPPRCGRGRHAPSAARGTHLPLLAGQGRARCRDQPPTRAGACLMASADRTGWKNSQLPRRIKCDGQRLGYPEHANARAA